MNRLFSIILSLTLTVDLFAVERSDFQSAPFDSLVSVILENNVTLAERRTSLLGDVDELKNGNLLPDPEIEFEHQWGHNNIGNKWSVNVKQSFDWPGVYKSRAKSVKAGEQIFSLMYKAEYYDVRLKITQALIDYIDANDKLHLREQILNNIDKIKTYTQTAYEHGEATIIDLKKLQFARAAANLQFEQAEVALQQIRQELFSLNGGKYLDLDKINGYIPDCSLNTEDHHISVAEKYDPAYAASSIACQQAQYDIKSARLSVLPGFTVGYIHNVELGEKFDGFNLGINLPVFSSRRRKAIAIAKAESVELQAFDYRTRLIANIHTDFITASKLNRNLSAYSGIFDNDNYLNLLDKSWKGGQITTIELLNEYNYFCSVYIEYLDLRRQLLNVLASLKRFEQ